ncbi:MAG TPA: protein kinase, partial [Ktedonobacteraceae bacterium]|nr:protein kinase [Ktedonobacteraceae bacterium]
MTETPDPLIGKQLGSYHILHGIGEGGMARVYKAYQERLRREVAIKVISPRIADQSDFRIRFEREAQVIASLEHPNIVVVYDFGEADHFTYLVMQYVGGGPLVNQLRSGRPIDPRRAANFALQMARALH